VDPFDQKIDLPGLSQIIDKLLLHFVQVIECELLGKLGGRGQQNTFGGALVKTLQTGCIDRLADRLAAVAAEGPLLTIDLSGHRLIRRNGQPAVKAGLVETQ